MRTLALFPLLLAISPSRIRIRRVTEPFQASFASKNLRSISVGMRFSASQVSNLESAERRRSAQHARRTRLGADLWRPTRPRKPLVRTPTDPHTAPPACEIGRPQRTGCRHDLQDIFVTGRFLADARAPESRLLYNKVARSGDYLRSHAR